MWIAHYPRDQSVAYLVIVSLSFFRLWFGTRGGHVMFGQHEGREGLIGILF
ncbi:MAG: hypothetical protein AB1742_12955 [bacterium]